MSTTQAPAIESDRIILRPFEENDCKVLHEILIESDIRKYLNWEPSTLVEAWWHLASMKGHWVLKNIGMWAVEDRNSNQLIGRIGFRYPIGHIGLELGWLIRKEFQGLGLATEGSKLALTYAKKNTNIDTVISIIDHKNSTSIKIAEKLGMKLLNNSHFDNNLCHVYSINF